MAIIETSRPFGATPSLVRRLVAGMSDIFAVVADWNEARLTRQALSRLSDRELDDIGLTYSDIDSIVARDRSVF